MTIALATALQKAMRRQPLIALALAACGSTALFLLFARWQLGYFDPFWRIATAVMLLITFPTAALVVFLWRYIDRRHRRVPENN